MNKSHLVQAIEEPWGIYIHVPWCRRRCHYCDFYFEVGQAQEGFSKKILAEWEMRETQWPKKQAQTLYFGGGTPSLLPASEIEPMVSGLKKSGRLALDAEITLEANPEDLSKDYLATLKDLGINRLSLGIQSFDDSILNWLGRKHSAQQARQIIETCNELGFERVSVDLIVGVPGENFDAIRDHIEWLFAHHVGHLSLYVLTVEEKTPLVQLIKKGRRELPDEDRQADAYEYAQRLLPSLGYQQYEISSFAQPGQESRHNRIYWSQGTYLGLGPGAHSMALQPDGSVTRHQNTPNLSAWWPSQEALTPTEALRESLAFGIRDMARGVDPTYLAHRHQVALPDTFNETTTTLIASGWVVFRSNRLFLTSLGARFADAVAREFLVSP